METLLHVLKHTLAEFTATLDQANCKHPFTDRQGLCEDCSTDMKAF